MCHSVHEGEGGSLYDVTSYLVDWSYVLLGEVSVPDPVFLLGALHPGWGGKVHPEGDRFHWRGGVVRILSECILVLKFFCRSLYILCHY